MTVSPEERPRQHLLPPATLGNLRNAGGTAPCNDEAAIDRQEFEAAAKPPSREGFTNRDQLTSVILSRCSFNVDCFSGMNMTLLSQTIEHQLFFETEK